jgi:hypothetical protein
LNHFDTEGIVAKEDIADTSNQDFHRKLPSGIGSISSGP